MTIDILRWKDFVFGDLFELKGIKQAKSQQLVEEDENGIPYIVQSLKNNMCSRYVNKQWMLNNGEPVVNGNVICLGVTTPAVSYQKDEFGASQIITARSEHMNEYNGLFVVSVLQSLMWQFSYERKPGIEVYKNMNIKLPATLDGKPDWDYMENYIRQVMDECELKYQLLAQTGISRHPVDITAWKDFKARDLFETVKDGKQVPTGSMISSKDLVEGNTPRVTVSDKNNGITGYYAVTSDKFNVYENFISVSFLGTVFYQPLRTSLDMKVHCLKPLGVELNDMTGLFLASVVKKSLGELDYTSQISSSMLPDLVLKLPVTSDGKPNWDYMEQYMQKVMDEQEHILECLTK